jgi:hypothetical protein
MRGKRSLKENSKPAQLLGYGETPKRNKSYDTGESHQWEKPKLDLLRGYVASPLRENTIFIIAPLLGYRENTEYGSSNCNVDISDQVHCFLFIL